VKQLTSEARRYPFEGMFFGEEEKDFSQRAMRSG
jgi:hypothetical protein